MSGGMTPKRGGLTLAERAELTRSDPARDAGAAAPREARHCWVVDPPEASGKWPGLLAEWARTPQGRWRGRTVYAVTCAGRTVLVEDWVDAAQLLEA